MPVRHHPSSSSVLVSALSSLLLAGCGGGSGTSPSANAGSPSGGGGGSGTATSYIVTATAGSGGSITPTSATVTSGKTTSLTVAANSGYAVQNVTGCGGSLSGITYTTGPVTANCTVSATFAPSAPSPPTQYTVTATAGAGGSITPTSATVTSGKTTSLTVAANSGYAVQSVTGCGGSLSGTTYTTGPVTADCTVSATFVASAQTSASVTIDVSSPMASVPAQGYGVDSAVYDNYLTNPGLGVSLKSGGFNAIRYPGGSYADQFNFLSDSNQTLNDSLYFAKGDTFNNWIADLIQPSGAKGVITINYGSNPSDDGPAPVSEAASWVQDADITHNYGILYWEIGNEIYGNGYYAGADWETDLHDLDQIAADRVGAPALSPTAYGTNAAGFIEAMKVVDPNIKCGVFVNTNTRFQNWNQDVLSAISSALQGSGYTLDFVILHWYPKGTDAQVLASTATINAQIAQVRSDIQKYYTLGNGNQLQILVTESAAPAGVGGILPYLFASDEFLTWFEQGAANVEYQELHPGSNQRGVYLDSSSNTPLGPWYGVNFDSTIARPGDRMVAATSTDPLLRVHGVRRSDGQIGVVLINEDPSNNTAVSVNVSGATLALSGMEYTFGNANFPAGSQTPSSGISSTSVNGIGNTFTVTVPAYSTVGLVIPEASTNTANLLANGSYVISNSQTGLVIGDPASNSAAGTALDMEPGSGGNNQTWILTNLGNNDVELVSATSSLALEVSQGSTRSGAGIDQGSWTNASNQVWKVVSEGDGSYELLRENSGLALGVPAATSGSGSSSLLAGTGLDQEPVTGAADQLWSFYN